MTLIYLPFDFVSRLSDKKSLSVCENFHTPRVDWDFTVVAFIAAFYLDCEQKQFEFGEAKSVDEKFKRFCWKLFI